MYLSKLQKYTLLHCYSSRGKRSSREKLRNFYRRKIPKNLERIISRSLQGLIKKGLLVACGLRTSLRWYIKSVRLTPKGRKYTRKMLGEQQKLPLMINDK